MIRFVLGINIFLTKVLLTDIFWWPFANNKEQVAVASLIPSEGAGHETTPLKIVYIGTHAHYC